MNRQSVDSMKKQSADSMNRLLADYDLRPQKPIHLSSNPGFGRDLASPEDDSMMTMQAYEYDDNDDAGGAAGNDYDSPLNSITKELGRSTVFEPKGGMFDDYAYRHRPLIDATDDTRDANDQSRDATEIVRGDQFRNRLSTTDDYRLEVEGTMVDDDGVPYDDYRDVDEIIDFAYDDNDDDDYDKGPTEPFETNYYNYVGEDDSVDGDDEWPQLGHVAKHAHLFFTCGTTTNQFKVFSLDLSHFLPCSFALKFIVTIADKVVCGFWFHTLLIFRDENLSST
jgi:hypothetical protein